MKRSLNIGLIVLTLTLCSCATMLNSKRTDLNIITSISTKLVVNHDSLDYSGAEKQITVERSKDPLTLTVYNDSLEKSISIEAKNSFAYWLNLYPSLHLWTGFLIDRNKAKRYTYPKRIYVNISDTTTQYFTYFPWSRKGRLDLHLSIPHINTLLLKPDNENDIKSNTGFWGITAGLDYYHSPKQFLSITATGVSDFFVPFPAAVDISGEYELMSSGYLAIANNHRVHKFLLGYGICYSRNIWDLRYYDRFDPPPPSRDPIKKSNNAFGFVFPLYYQIGEHFFIGAVYRPTIFRLSETNPFDYEHLISIDFGWKIRLKG